MLDLYLIMSSRQSHRVAQKRIFILMSQFSPAEIVLIQQRLNWPDLVFPDVDLQGDESLRNLTQCKIKVQRIVSQRLW